MLDLFKLILKDGLGVVVILSFILMLVWFCYWKNSIWSKLNKKNTGFSDEQLEKYKKSNNNLFGIFLFLNFVIWVIAVYFYNIESSNWIYPFFVSVLLFLILILFFVPRQNVVLKYDNKVIDKSFYLNLWTYYVYKDKGVTNFDLFSSNISGITNYEVKQVEKGLAEEEIDQLKRFLIYSDLPKYRDSMELSFSIIIDKIIKTTGSVTILGLVYNMARYIYGEIRKSNEVSQSNDIVKFFLNYGGTIVLLTFLILLFWFILSLLFNEFSYNQKRKQVNYILPKMIEAVLEKKEK